VSRDLRGVVLVGDRGTPFDGVIDHATLLGEALRKHLDVEVLTRDLSGGWRGPEGAPRRRADVSRALRTSDSVILSYTPWNLGLGWKHWRFLVELPRLLWAARSTKRVLFLHELSTTAPGRLGTLNRRTQEWQFRLVSWGFPTVVGAAFLVPPRLSKRRALLPLAVGSNLPDMRHQRDTMRRELGLENSLVVASFVQGYRSPTRHLVSAGLQGCRDDSSAPVTHLVLGSSAESQAIDGVGEYRAGPVSAERLASLLAAADVLLAPFPDGASTRRTTLAAALQHGLPVITNPSALTTPWMRTAPGLVLAEPLEGSFREAASALAKDADHRWAVGRAARELYEDHFDWRTIADSLTAVMMRHHDP
jgi:glycosyltransferase involved in cell wall biosynthesis